MVGAEMQIRTEQGPDILIDLTAGPLPFDDDSIAEIFTAHFLEHVPMDAMLKEIHRVLRPDGTVQIIMPYATSAAGLYPGHSAFYTEQWFQQNLPFNNLFAIQRIAWRKTRLYDELPWILRRVLGFERTRQIMFNVCDEFMIDAVPKKRPGVDYTAIKPEQVVYSAP